MTRTLTTATIVLAITLAFAFDAKAQNQKFLLVENPSPAIQPGPVFLPKFGFESYNLHGIGERVTHVRCHGLAAGMGLEPGDTILSLNGFPLTYHGAWNQALSSAMYQGGFVQLAIRDVRTGYVVYRNTHVGGGPGNGPITPKVQHYNAPGPITQKSVAVNNNLSPAKQLKVNSQSIQQLGKLLKIGE